jgi:hypothetical protein
MPDQIDRPIFLLGPGRAGSTLLQNILSFHRDIGYFISWSNKYPKWPWLAFGARFRVPAMETKGWLIKGYPGPTEAYRIWTYCFPKFYRAIRSACIDQAGIERLKHLIRVHLRVQGKSRFLAKLTGPPMFTFFRSIFPDALFVWIDRDPRAVCYSYFQKGWIKGPPKLTASLSSDEKLRHVIKTYLEFFEKTRQESIPPYWIRYEDFISSPAQELRKLMDYLQLEADSRLIKYVSEWRILNQTNQRWKQALSTDQQAILNEMLEAPLREKGYWETTPQNC